MNNIFNIKRFASHAMTNYYYNRRAYLGVVVGTVVMLLLMLCNFEYAYRTLTWESNRVPIDRILGIFSSGFFCAGFVFTMWFCRNSLQGINGRNITMQDLLLPVSTFERYIFALLNSTVVAGVVYIGIFEVVSNCIESMYMFSDHGYMFKGFIGYNAQHAIDNGFVQECHITLKDIWHDMLGSRIDDWGWRKQIFVIVYGLSISIFMWGEVTFKKGTAVIWTILLHVAIVAVIFGIVNYIQPSSHVSLGTLHVSYNYQAIEDIYTPYIFGILYLLIATYQWVVWKKLKTQIVTK